MTYTSMFIQNKLLLKMKTITKGNSYTYVEKKCIANAGLSLVMPQMIWNFHQSHLTGFYSKCVENT